MLKATCHCNAVELAIDIPALDTEKLVRCDCSMCVRRAAIVTAVPIERVSVVKGADKLSLYQFHTQVAEHYFCSVCGIYTHHRRRANPSEYAINIGCIEGVNPLAYSDVKTLSGKAHPLDSQIV